MLQCDWDVNVVVVCVLFVLEKIQKEFGKVLLVDIIVLVGVVGVEKVVSVVGLSIYVLFVLGCVDVCQDQIDIEMFELLELIVDGFRNYCVCLDVFIIELLLIDKVQ